MRAQEVPCCGKQSTVHHAAEAPVISENRIVTSRLTVLRTLSSSLRVASRSASTSASLRSSSAWLLACSSASCSSLPKEIRGGRARGSRVSARRKGGSLGRRARQRRHAGRAYAYSEGPCAPLLRAAACARP